LIPSDFFPAERTQASPPPQHKQPDLYECRRTFLHPPHQVFGCISLPAFLFYCQARPLLVTRASHTLHKFCSCASPSFPGAVKKTPAASDSINQIHDFSPPKPLRSSPSPLALPLRSPSSCPLLLLVLSPFLHAYLGRFLTLALRALNRS